MIASINNNPKSCWEFWECPPRMRKKCLAYINNIGDKCWLLMEHAVEFKCPASYEGCEKCPWYKMKNS